jgi:hypothetical protein
MRAGYKAITRPAGQTEDDINSGGSVLDSLGWEGDAEGADPHAKPESIPLLEWTNDDKRAQIEHWLARP